MKRSLVILLTAVSISAMTAGTAFPAFAEATEAEAEETTDGAENAAGANHRTYHKTARAKNPGLCLCPCEQ